MKIEGSFHIIIKQRKYAGDMLAINHGFNISIIYQGNRERFNIWKTDEIEPFKGDVFKEIENPNSQWNVQLCIRDSK